MPFKCLDPASQAIYSFKLSDDEWQALTHKNKTSRHLGMECCGAQVTLKRSRRGRPFFAHKARGDCSTAPETESHLELKWMAVIAAQYNGWKAVTEETGLTPSGEQWKADVLAQKGKHKVAIEIQWSSQTNEETLRRQEKYRESGVRGLWLLRQRGFPITRALPAVCISGGLKEGFTAEIPGHQVLPMEEFLDAAFGGRFQYGLPMSIDATVSVRGAQMTCWHQSCKARTRVVTKIAVVFGPYQCSLSLGELGDHPELLQQVLQRMPRIAGMGEIKPRYSKTAGRRYMSNGCVRCDRLMGDFYMIPEYGSEEELHRFPTRISQHWKRAFEKSGYDFEEWSVYPAINNA